MRNPDQLPPEEIKQVTPEITEPESPLPEYLKMYENSGQDEITAHSFLRYLRDKKNDGEIQDVIDRQLEIHEVIDKETLAYEGLRAAQEAYRNMIFTIPENKRVAFIERGLTMNSLEIKVLCEKMVDYYIPNNWRKSFFDQGFATDYAESKKRFAELVKYIERDDDRTHLEEKIGLLIEKSFASDDTKNKRIYAGIIGFAPRDKRAELVEKGFATDDIEVQKKCATEIAECWTEGADKIDKRGALSEKLISIIEKGFATSDVSSQTVYAEMIEYTSYASEDKTGELIEKGLITGNVDVQKTCIKMIPLVVDVNKRAELVEKGLATGNVDVQKVCAKSIIYTPQHERKRFFQIAKMALGDRLVESSLYENRIISDEKFSRTGFEKTGSETTLIGDKLKGKTILRHIKPTAFLAWQKVYEAHELWKEEGFDYVPIEPIQSFKLNKNRLVDVYSGVLDLTLNDWQRMDGDFIEKLEKEAKNIEKVLIKSGIRHGHPRFDNFCLRFFRDTNGKVDFSKKPRIYLIDFDQAVSL